MRDSALIAAALSHTWALHRPILDSVLAVINRHGAGVDLDAAEIEEVAATGRRRTAVRRDGVRLLAAGYGAEPADPDADRYQLVGSTAVVSVTGLLSKYADRVNGISQPQGMAHADIVRLFNRAADDSRARGVVLDIDSGGGTVAGMPDIIESLDELRAAKPTVAFLHDLGASGAYWLACHADEVYCSAIADVGGIGVYCVVEDSSEAYAQMGARRILIASGPAKGAGEPGTPVTEEHIRSLGRNVAETAEVFIQDVAARRGLSIDATRALADGSCRVGQVAVEAGLCDGVRTLRQLVEEMQAAAAA